MLTDAGPNSSTAVADDDPLQAGQMVSIEFTPTAGRPVRLLGHLAQVSDQHLVVDGLTGAAARPNPADTVTVSLLIGRRVSSAETRLLRVAETGGPRLALRRPPAFAARDDRRRSPRAELTVVASCIDLDVADAPWFSSETVDVSPTGVQVRAERRLDVHVGHRVVVLLRLRKHSAAFLGEVRAVRDEATPGRCRYGIEITAIGPVDRLALDALVAPAT